MYVSVFEGNEAENVPFDQEAFDIWKQFVPEDRIILGNKKDNFWEMGDQGPCGPCSEIHIDLRTDAERAAVIRSKFSKRRSSTSGRNMEQCIYGIQP